MTLAPAEVVDRYLQLMRAGDAGVADLFAPDARLQGLGSIVVGKPAIAEFYRSAQTEGQASPELVAMAETEGRVFAELRITVVGGIVLQVVDVFVIRDELIESLTYYLAHTGPVAAP